MVTRIWGGPDLNSILGLGLPVVDITTIDGEEPWCDTVAAPEGCMGQGIINMNKVKGRLRVLQGEQTLYDSGEYSEEHSGMTIRVRGNSSAWSWKKPFKIKLEKKADLLSRGDEDRFRDKSWLLIKDSPLSLNTIIGLKVNELMGMQWTPAYKIVNVMMNGDYRGVYLLIESVKRNSRCRIDVDKDTGYIFEYDPYWWNENLYFDTPYTLAPDAKSAKFTFKEPDDDHITSAQIAYLQGYLSSLEASLTDGTYEQYLDLDSFVSWLLAQDFLGNGDGHGSNLFITKYDQTSQSRIRMANLWDFDAIMSTSDIWSMSHGVFYFGIFWEVGDAKFETAYKMKWNRAKDRLVSSLTSFIRQFVESETGKAFERSIPYDGERWSATYMTTGEMAEQAIDWFTSRKVWLDKSINGENGIHVTITKDDEVEDYYDLIGRKLNQTQKGINIIRRSDGTVRKELVK